MKHIMLVNAVHKEQMRMATVNEKGILVDFNIENADERTNYRQTFNKG